MTSSADGLSNLYMHHQPPSCVIDEVHDDKHQQQEQQEQQQQHGSTSSSPQPPPAQLQRGGDQEASAAAGVAAGETDTAAAAAAAEQGGMVEPADRAPSEHSRASDAGGAGSGSTDAPSTPQQQQPQQDGNQGAQDEQQQQQQTQQQQEQAAVLLEECERLKAEGNAAYATEQYDAALQLYWQAIDQAPESAAQQRAVYYANAAACYLRQELWQLAAEQCSAALQLNDGYVKALVRRCQALRELDDLERALADAQRVLELEPGHAWASKVAAELGPQVQARQEKLKEEMMGKLKDLGNSLLGKFGLSLDNFKAEQDPATGGYSVKFVNP